MLDDLIPAYDFAERHHRHIPADAATVWRALASVTLQDLTITRPLVALRHPFTRTEAKPLLTHGPLSPLHLEAGRLAIAGAVARPWQRSPERRTVADLAEFVDFDEPGWTKYLTDFRIAPVEGGCVLSTETRGYSTDGPARRRFRCYWLAIRIPSGIVRRDLLRTIARKSVGTASLTPT